MFDQLQAPVVEQSKRARSAARLQCAIDIDTSSVLPVDQFDFFCSWYSGVAEFELLQGKNRSFPAHQIVWDLDKLTVMHLKLPPLRYACRHLRKPTIDNWCLTLPLPQSLFPEYSLQTGDDLSLRSLADPFEYVTEKNDFLAFFLPRNLDCIQSAKIEVRESSKRFLAEYMLLLHRSLPELSGIDVPHIATATTSLLAACLEPSRDHIVEAERPIEAVFMRRACKVIAKRLADPKLSPELLCREIGTSRSGLYRVFEPVGGVSTYIRRERLRKTLDALTDSSDRRQISTIAEQWGFVDPSAYSRMFKREFGISPRDARARGPSNIEFARPTDAPPTLRSLLVRNH